MPRQRSPNRDKAFEIYKEHDGNIELVEIAGILNVPEGTVRGWKNKDGWDRKLNGTFQKNTERSKPKGGQPGNQNAVDHGAPPGNLNAVKHGAYQTIYAAYLPADEKAVYEQLPGDADLEAEIRLLRLKITRLLNRQEDFFYDMFGNRHDKQISEEDREAGILACAKQLEKLVRTQDKIRRSALDDEEQRARVAKLQVEINKIKGEDLSKGQVQEFIAAVKLGENDVKALFEDDADEES